MNQVNVSTSPGRLLACTQHTFLTNVTYTKFCFGIELNQLTGIAAILTFPLDVDVVEAEERAAKEEEEQRKQAEGEGGVPDASTG